MKCWIKTILPVVSVAYIIAFMEIDLPGLHQTWNDPYDTYIVSQQNNSHNTNKLADLIVLNPAVSGITSVTLIGLKLFYFIVIPGYLLFYRSYGIYLKNCTFLI